MALIWRYDRRDEVSERVRAAAADALYKALEHIGAESDRTVPLEEGTLMRSRTVAVDKDTLVGAVGYGGAASAYAVRQHEELGWKHKPGRRAKFLELAVKEQADRVQNWLAETLRDAFR